MDEYIADIRSETQALKQLSAARLTEGRKHYDGTHRRALLLPERGCDD